MFLEPPSPSAQTVVDSPLGPLRLKSTFRGLWAVEYVDDAANGDDDASRDLTGGGEAAAAVLSAARLQLEEYFAGRLKAFDLPIDLSRQGTPFQQQVWRTLLRIPYGCAVSYQCLAAMAGFPRAVRAVANAVGANPVSVIVPCHRVIRKSGELGGYGGGVHRKRYLLAHEQRGRAGELMDASGKGESFRECWVSVDFR